VKDVIISYVLSLSVLLPACSSNEVNSIESIAGRFTPAKGDIWLSHEHILVDFIGADSINPKAWHHDSVIKSIQPFLAEIKKYNVKYFVDATPAYLGRDVVLLEKLSAGTGVTILTNTGFYGAVNDKYIPSFAFEKTAEQIAEIWINEFRNGIDGTSIKPGFIKISVDASDTLDAIDAKLVEAAAITHLKTGLTILSHTGEAKALWPQLDILEKMNVSAKAFVWVHAQNEKDNNNYLLAAKRGCWIALDGVGWDLEKHIEKLVFAKQQDILELILISHDAGWYDPQKSMQNIKPYTAIFTHLHPKLLERGFTEDEFRQLVSDNPSKAFAVSLRKL
jgi:phosphotriesterase-related protein